MSSAADIPLVFSSPVKVRKTELRLFLADLTRRVTRGRAISCLIADDRELRRLNKMFRKKDYATDVLSFPSGHGDDAGDLAISIDRARAQAADHRHSVEVELRILMLHGALHLAGMDHETDAGEMARAEMRWRKRLQLPTGLIERSAVAK